MVLVSLTITVSSVLEVLPFILKGRMIDQGLIGQVFSLLIRLVILSLGVTLLANGIGVLESYINAWVAQHITYDMRNTMFKAIAPVPSVLHKQKSGGHYHSDDQ